MVKPSNCPGEWNDTLAGDFLWTNTLQNRIAESARGNVLRERARSEYVRDRWMVRLFALRAGELSGIGNDVFYLTLDELIKLLAGEAAVTGCIPQRREAHERYRALPALPSIIRGRFDPFIWVNDPNRRSGIYDATARTTHMEAGKRLRGSPGSAGQVEGLVRLIITPEDGNQLRQGEILVTVQTDIAWTLIFPKAAAVVTDVGAPLSHAAIVARELGIPAVVGCGDATSRLKTGDRVRADGARGIVEVLE